MSGKIFCYSPKDALLVGLSLIQIAIVVLGAVSFGAAPWTLTAALAAAAIFLHCTNFQCVAHNFIHNPFFRSDLANGVFSVVNTLALGVPQTLYRVHHLHHHKYNNDAQDPVTGTTRDRTSTYRYSKVSGREESIVTYALVGPVRSEIGYLVEGAHKAGSFYLVVIETVAFAGFVTLLGIANWKGLIAFYVPVWYLGQASALAENYLEHHYAIPGNRLTDSVSCYNRFYNFIWFNNGYHQEHHFRPQVHWSKVHELRAEMLPDTERRVVRGAHWFNFAALQPPMVRSRCASDSSDGHARPSSRTAG